MRRIEAHAGRLIHALNDPTHRRLTLDWPVSGFDQLAPPGLLTRGATHELLTEPQTPHAWSLAMALASGFARAQNPDTPPNPAHRLQSNPHACVKNPGSCPSRASPIPLAAGPPDDPGLVVIIDPPGPQRIFPAALPDWGLKPTRVLIVEPPDFTQQLWTLVESLRCPGVRAVVSPAVGLSKLWARRIQLAAESSNAVALLLRTTASRDRFHSATTRWRVTPATGERLLQRWTVQLIHGHGGRTDRPITLEFCRAMRLLRSSDPMVARPCAATPVHADTA